MFLQVSLLLVSMAIQYSKCMQAVLKSHPRCPASTIPYLTQGSPYPMQCGEEIVCPVGYHCLPSCVAEKYVCCYYDPKIDAAAIAHNELSKSPFYLNSHQPLSLLERADSTSSSMGGSAEPPLPFKEAKFPRKSRPQLYYHQYNLAQNPSKHDSSEIGSISQTKLLSPRYSATKLMESFEAFCKKAFIHFADVIRAWNDNDKTVSGWTSKYINYALLNKCYDYIANGKMAHRDAGASHQSPEPPAIDNAIGHGFSHTNQLMPEDRALKTHSCEANQYCGYYLYGGDRKRQLKWVPAWCTCVDSYICAYADEQDDQLMMYKYKCFDKEMLAVKRQLKVKRIKIT